MLLSFGFHGFRDNNFLCIKRTGGHCIFILDHIDDVIIKRGSHDLVEQFLGKAFELKDLESLSYCLGIQVQRSSAGLDLSQAKYISDSCRSCYS